ncbi:MAG: hypothetical protein ABMB14_00945 [Myxococcota bacterium]
MKVDCRGCHRVEEWTGAARTVVVPGGARRTRTPERDAFAAVAGWLRGELPPVVGRCAVCGQPMVGHGVPTGWTIPGVVEVAPDRTIVLHSGGSAPGTSRRVAVDEAERAVQAAFPAPLEEPALGGWLQGTLVLVMLAPIGVWVFSVMFVAAFLSHWRP